MEIPFQGFWQREMRQALVVADPQGIHRAKSWPIVQSATSEFNVERRDFRLFTAALTHTGQVQRSAVPGVCPRHSSTHKDACRLISRGNPEVNLAFLRFQCDFNAVFPTCQSQCRDPFEITNLEWFVCKVLGTFLIHHIQESHSRKPSFSRDTLIRPLE